MPSSSELTRSNSAESAITLDHSTIDLQLRFHGAPQVKSTEWTNEKHSMYIGSLEASFVRELYDSVNSSGRVMKRNSRTPFSYDQNINCKPNKPLLERSADSRVVIEIMEYPDAQEPTFRNNGSQLNCIYESTRSLDRQNLVSSTEEVSDQNFVDDVSGGYSSCKSLAKRLKTTSTNFSRKIKEANECHES